MSEWAIELRNVARADFATAAEVITAEFWHDPGEPFVCCRSGVTYAVFPTRARAAISRLRELGFETGLSRKVEECYDCPSLRIYTEPDGSGLAFCERLDRWLDETVLIPRPKDCPLKEAQ